MKTIYHISIILVCLLLAATAYAQGDMRDLGTLGGPSSEATAINGAGDIVGVSETSAGENHAFFISSITGNIQDLGTLGGTFSQANDINNSGQVVGQSRVPSGYFHSFIWTQATGMTDLGTLGGAVSIASGINSQGHVVGASTVATGQFRAFLWTPSDGMIDLGSLDPNDNNTRAAAINDAGQVVGTSGNSGYPETVRAVLWEIAGQNIKIVDLGTLGVGANVAVDINEFGQAVGWSSTVPTDTSNSGGVNRAFLWTDGVGMVDLRAVPQIPPSLTSAAEAINSFGQVVGRAVFSGANTTAMLWTASGGMADLGTLGGSLSVAYDINNNGQVVGRSQTASGQSHAFLLGIGVTTVQEQIADIIEDVNELVGIGILTEANGNSLTSSLHRAIQKLNQGSNLVSARVLRGFNNQVTAFMNAGLINLQYGEALIAAANNIIYQL